MNKRIFKTPYAKQYVSTKQYSHAKTFGAAPLPTFPSMLAVFTDFLVQTDVNCTAYSGVGERGAVTGKKYDPEKQWANELKFLGVSSAPNGVTLDAKMQTGIKVGFVPVGEAIPVDQAAAYLWVTIGDYDWFDTIRLAMYQLNAKYGKVIPITIGVNWYNEWDITKNGVLTMSPVQLLGGHDIEICGIQTYSQDGVDYIMLMSTWGEEFGDKGIFRVPRDVFNKYFYGFGSAYWTDDKTLKIAKLNALESLIQNVIILYQKLIALNTGYPPPPPAVPIEPHVSRINDWANAIQHAEGWYIPGQVVNGVRYPLGSVSYQHNNPGNLKYSTLTASWGAIQGASGTDGGHFCKFPSYDVGFTALCNFLTLGAENELIAFHSSRNLVAFTNVYAGKPPLNYIDSILTELKVAGNINVNSLL